ncbi:SsgA family sporulation/cell division regulator [Kitasatospora sp. NPDC088134]|uniref:SsgA family sporulation/cell division regulator n=1 Tax=Kitasatospora sp. NPDC088134 TaxID=3364071 RepID=UPI00380287A2
MPAAVSVAVPATLPESPFPQVVIAAELRFDPALPYGVALAFPPQNAGGEIVWWFGRDLLDAGCRAPAGEGDVRVEPGRHGRVLVTLGNRRDRAVVSLPSGTVADFLAGAYRAVPVGSESEHLDLAPVLARLLA